MTNGSTRYIQPDRVTYGSVHKMVWIDSMKKRANFQAYYTKDGLAGNVVSCILEDERGQLWMGTNNGLSSFNRGSLKF